MEDVVPETRVEHAPEAGVRDSLEPASTRGDAGSSPRPRRLPPRQLRGPEEDNHGQYAEDHAVHEGGNIPEIVSEQADEDVRARIADRLCSSIPAHGLPSV